jgi:hypothetical protein
MPFRLGGRPRHLFAFSIQSLTLRYAASQVDITVGDDMYLASAIERSEVKETAEKPQDQITVTLPYNRNPAAASPVTQPLGDLWHPYIPSDTVRVVCMTYDAAQPAAAPDVDWTGVVAQPKFTDGQLELTCIPGSMIDRARYQGPKWSVNNWKNIYSQGPRGGNLIAEAIPVPGTVTAVSGNDVTAAAFTPPQRTFVGGVATWTDSAAAPHTANITAAADTTLTLDDVTGIEVGTVVTAYTTAISIDGPITAINGLQVTVPAAAGAPFPLLGGDVQWTRTNGVVERRSIVNVDSSGTVLTLHYAGPDLAVGTVLHARPGCDNSWDAWASRGRSLDYGGSVYMPVASPYDGQSMSWG